MSEPLSFDALVQLVRLWSGRGMMEATMKLAEEGSRIKDIRPAHTHRIPSAATSNSASR